MRLFVALDIPDEIRKRIASYVDELRRMTPDAKWVKPESYHVTLKFIGEWKRTPHEVASALSQVRSEPFEVAFRSNGFFPNPRSPRVFWTGILAHEQLPTLAHQVDRACVTLGIPAEDHEYSPHLTLARSGSGSPRPKKQEPTCSPLKRLAERIATMPAPDFGTMHATEFFLYESKLSPGGAKYTKLKGFALSGH
jgi:RNA 2',3'-cyclic 3'-phosphodiesterase